MKQTIAQAVLNIQPEYIDYDFDARKSRRSANGSVFIDRDICKRNLLDVKKILDKHNVRFWLVYGTLLGAIRESDFISHDTDTDLGTYENDRELLIAAIRDLLHLGFELIRTKAPDDLVTVMRNDEYIDIAIFRAGQDEAGNKYYYYHGNREYGTHFDQLLERSFLGESFHIPTNAEALLTSWYGANWRAPKRAAPAKAYNYNPMRNLISRVVSQLSRLRVR